MGASRASPPLNNSQLPLRRGVVVSQAAASTRPRSGGMRFYETFSAVEARRTHLACEQLLGAPAGWRRVVS